MEILDPEGNVFDAPTKKEWEKKHFPNLPLEQEVACRCGWGGLRADLEHETDIEQMHPKNRNNPSCNMMDRSGCHWTAFEKCPKCKRCLFADRMFIG